MLRICVEHAEQVTIGVEGRLAGQWVEELARCWRQLATTQDPGAITVRLDGVTFVDAAGKRLCRTLHEAGTRLVASGCMMRAIIAEVEQ
jgi:uracil-DNA glycosylase